MQLNLFVFKHSRGKYFIFYANDLSVLQNYNITTVLTIILKVLNGHIWKYCNLPTIDKFFRLWNTKSFMLRYTYFEKNSPKFRRKLPVSSYGSKTRSQLTISKGRSYFYARNIYAKKLDFDHSSLLTNKAYWTILVILNKKQHLIKKVTLLASI